MLLHEKDNKITIEELESFDIGQILECGQCFRFNKLDENFYTIIANKKLLHIKQEKESVSFFPCDMTEFETVWLKYFDITRDYDYIKKIISRNDRSMQTAIDFAPGIRILNQDPFECLVSFIISQNNRITMIKKVIENLCGAFGEPIENGMYAFPTSEKLDQATIDEIMSQKTGFRAKYIKDACKKITNKTLLINDLKQDNQARDKLLMVAGVGQKVADCVLLFSLERHDVFPTDVWIKRVMEEFYFYGKETSIKQIHTFAQTRWGKYSGFAQQYLFNYAKEMKIGKK